LPWFVDIGRLHSGGKDVFKVLVFLVFKNQKPRKVDFLVFMLSWVLFFSYKFCAQPYGYYLFIYFIFNLHEFINLLTLASAA